MVASCNASCSDSVDVVAKPSLRSQRLSHGSTSSETANDDSSCDEKSTSGFGGSVPFNSESSFGGLLLSKHNPSSMWDTWRLGLSRLMRQVKREGIHTVLEALHQAILHCPTYLLDKSMLNPQEGTSRLRDLLPLPVPACYSAEVVTGRRSRTKSNISHVEWLDNRSLNALYTGSAATFGMGSPSMSQSVAMVYIRSAASYYVESGCIDGWCTDLERPICC